MDDGVTAQAAGGAGWPSCTVDEAVRSHAERRADEAALLGPAADLTWSQLDRAAGRAAGIISRTGGPGSRVAWLGQNEAGFAITLLGSWRRRAALVGLNWRLPDTDLAASCVEAGVTHLFASAAFADRARAIAGAGVHIALIDPATTDPWPELASAEPLEPAAEDIALVFFTSGSTGVPKAVPVTRLAIEAGVAAPTPHGFDESSRLLIVPPLFHLAGSYWVLYGLRFGTRQSYLAEASPRAIVDALAEHRITHAVFVPTLIRAVIDRLAVQPRRLPDFRHLGYGASSITVPMLREALEVLDCEFCQVYGMTEAGGVVAYLRPEDHQLTGATIGRLASAGQVSADCEIEVRDLTTGAVLPAGQSGALWFRTPSMGHHYLGRPEESARTFVDGWLNTRDVGYLDQDGYLFVEGRSDDMIISGGENVHPSEVETVIAELPEVAEVVVFGSPDVRWGRRVSAAIVTRDGDLTESAVVRHCRERLAHYKVPRSVVFMTELPKTATGKIARSALPAIG
ncbi:AMP-binding protein [Nocardia sp. NPDC003963]